MIYTVTLNPAIDRELSVPQIVFSKVLRTPCGRVDYGGKGFNVSRMLMALGTPSTAVGFLGGKSGEFLQEGLRSLGIQTDFVWIEAETRTNVTIVDESDGRYLKVNEPGPHISPQEYVRLLEKIKARVQASDWWVLAGSLPPGVPTGVYAELIQYIQAQNAHVLLDTSGPPLHLGCVAAPFLIKPNQTEADHLANLPVTPSHDMTDPLHHAVATARTIQKEYHLPHLIISLGAAGAIYQDHQETWHAIAPSIQEKNPIGAGDAMVGGLVWALSQTNNVLEALRWGIACGTATASLSGTTMASRDLVESFLPHTIIKKVKDL